MPKDQFQKKSARTLQETILHRNKTIVRTYKYWHEEQGLRLDRTMDKLTDVFFMAEDTIYYKILKQTTITEAEMKSIKPLIRMT